MKTQKKRAQVKLFCTACGEELDYFAFSPLVKRLDAVKKGAANCTRTGKKKGRMCAKQFIADPNALSLTFRPKKLTSTGKDHMQSLKSSILKKIAEKND